MLRVYERFLDFYIGHDGFFQKVLKLVYAQFGSNFDFFEIHFFLLLKRGRTSLSNSKSVEVTKKRDRLLVSKVEINFQLCQRNCKNEY